MKAKYRWFHECERPNMRKTLSREVDYRTWYGAKRTRIENHDVWETRDLLWTCDCGAEWEWSFVVNHGYWWCRSRPEVWKDIEL